MTSAVSAKVSRLVPRFAVAPGHCLGRIGVGVVCERRDARATLRAGVSLPLPPGARPICTVSATVQLMPSVPEPASARPSGEYLPKDGAVEGRHSS